MSEPNPEKSASVSANMNTPAIVQKQEDNVAKPALTDTTQPQFKIVRVRKPDGTIVKVRRPVTAEEASKLVAAASKAKSSPTPQKPKPDTTTKTAVSPATVKPAPKTETKVLGEDEKPKVVTAKTSNAPTKSADPEKADPEKAVTASPQASTKPTTPATVITTQAPSSNTDNTLDTAGKGARLYRGLHRLHRGSSRLIAVVAPQWEIDDWQEGDEEYSDDDDDDNDEDEERYDSDDDKKVENNNQTGSQGAGNAGANAAAEVLAASAASNIATIKTPREQAENSEKKLQSTTTKETSPKTAKTAVVKENEISGSDLEKPSFEKPEPVQGKSLEKRYKDWSRYIIWSIMILFPLLFIIIGILVACRNKHRVGDALGRGTDQALTVAISVWPIIFAAIVAQSLRAYATYRVERGVRLMTLEQLVNSNSVASSIKQPFLLRRFNWITVALLILWGLSPLATQAMQRISRTKDDVTTSVTKLRYVDTVTSNSNYLSASSEMFDSVQAEFNRLYSAAFLPTYITLGSDPYNNALIPIINLSADPNEWQDTDPTMGANPDYTSAYGIPIAAVSNYSAYEFFTEDSKFNVTMSAAYLSFSCLPLQVVDGTFMQNSLLTYAGATEATLEMYMTPMSGKTNGSLAISSIISKNTTDPNHLTDVDLQALAENNTYAYTNCTFSQTFLDLKVSCQSGACYVYAAKPMNTTSTPPFVGSGSESWMKGLLGSSGATNNSNPTATDTERYLMNGGYDLANSSPRLNLTTVDHEFFEQNLAYLMNTFWSIGFAPTNLTNFFYNSTAEPFNKDLHPTAIYAPGVKIDTFPIYHTQFGWLAALMICSIFLLLAGIFSIWWDARTVSPDVLGFASSVVRKSKYVQLPPVASAASGAERARALGEVRVMMQDVKPSAKVGRIALGTAHPNAKRLEAGRSYR